jgi:hypothetical protein
MPCTRYKFAQQQLLKPTSRGTAIISSLHAGKFWDMTSCWEYSVTVWLSSSMVLINSRSGWP